jgi:hypothetical protein
MAVSLPIAVLELIELKRAYQLADSRLRRARAEELPGAER